MKLWQITTENKCFVKMLWHLLGKCVKTTILLVCSSGIFFFSLLFVLFFLLNIYKNPHIYCYINTTNFTIFSFSTVVLHCSYSVFHCSSTVPFWLATFFFSLLFVLFFPLYIYSVFALCVHYSCNSALVSWVLFYFILFFFSNQFVFFFSFKY